MNALRVIGYRHSVYSRSVRIALVELSLPYSWEEVDPFSEASDHHPFGRVPVLFDGRTRVYESWAILSYLYRISDRTRAPLVEARAAQIAGIATSYAYWPLVRQVYSHGVFRPAFDLEYDMSKIQDGLEQAGSVLNAIEDIATEGHVLGSGCEPEDCILFPMIDAFRRYPAAAELLAHYPALNSWWIRMNDRDKIAETFCRLRPEA
ncbi:glutathione S-transferase family protein [Ruegeria sp. EL01]|uniref:glutathione S-transferase family protein n=1 Tax=Ruegeria sp. EL01 TaxID=2107578 RepID=UPI000EA83349|nr:glutathione S-transferase family protein [Ruegeria sp. EL01]